jgi:hypothetical protein
MARPNIVVEWLALLLVMFGWFWVQISSWRPAVLAKVFCKFLCPSGQMLGHYLKLGHDLFLIYPFQFIIHPII